ncbi:hypothetical protein G7J84_004803 [Salmonella enterica subsp. enterica serovar 4,[5],12:i:-]|nr:hypothetical protein [Salmonella enterica subsp. enterica serovar 4,[5],12:i:-]EEI6576741.1 hypothetical protein [Salmonella enterica subsp. enterica serovar 4,[5],12:i:-]EEI8595912.1 hypothetical protein [Salmonella enterica subsp. enterica serovar 4,[5],12:i:-]
MSSKEEKFPNQNNTGTIKKLIKKLLDKLDDASEFYYTAAAEPAACQLPGCRGLHQKTEVLHLK